MTDFVVKMVGFTLKMMDFILNNDGLLGNLYSAVTRISIGPGLPEKVHGVSLQVMNLPLKMMSFQLKVMMCQLKMMIFSLKTTDFRAVE